MADETGIEWADSTFNPWMGCTKVSPACDHCYAERDTKRFGRVQWGAGQPRVRTSAANWKKPLQWNAQHWAQCPQCGWRGTYGTPSAPRCGRCGSPSLPARRRVFCASLADVFDNEVDPAWRRDLFDLIELTPNLDWLLLTKRIGNVSRLVADARTHDWLAGRRNVWLGATICNQEEADRDIPKLLQVPAAVRFVSIEPMLGPITLPLDRIGHWNALAIQSNQPWATTRLHWVIAGGESGPNGRPMHPDWARSLRDQCAAAGVPFLFKQWGEWCDAEEFSSEMQEDYDVRGLAENGCIRIGKKAAGRMLDGMTHTEYPMKGVAR